MTAGRIRSRDRDAIIQALKAGVTPRIGIQYIQVGRANEIKALYQDVERITQGGTAFRLIIGEYGSGKTFFLSLIRSIALEKKLVTIHADLSPNRRLHSSGDHYRNLYSELMKNVTTRSKPEGGALISIVEKFISSARTEASESGSVSSIIKGRLQKLMDLVGGYDFAEVINAYYRGYESDNDELKLNAIRWLRAEYSTKTEAKEDLGVRTLISQHSLNDSLKLVSLFFKQAGYDGLLVCLDEMVNLYKLSNTQSRTSNYEEILFILNDCLQGSAQHIGFLFGGTPEFLLDTRRGLYSYEALQSRLAENSFARKAGVIDYSSPALHLAKLTPEEMYLLLKNIRNVFAAGDSRKYLLPDEALEAFLGHCNKKIGDAYFRTPRNTIKAFIDIMSVIEQNNNISWNDLIESVTIEEEKVSDMPLSESDGELENFRL